MDTQDTNFSVCPDVEMASTEAAAIEEQARMSGVLAMFVAFVVNPRKF